MLDVGPLVGDIPTTEVTIRNFDAPTANVFGETEATFTDTLREVVVHPSPTRVMERGMDADRHRETIAVYSTEPLRTVGTTTPDWIFYQNRWYVLGESADYEELGGIFITSASLVEGSVAAP